jgi:hypothetical protein
LRPHKYSPGDLATGSFCCARFGFQDVIAVLAALQLADITTSTTPPTSSRASRSCATRTSGTAAWRELLLVAPSRTAVSSADTSADPWIG